MKISKPLVVAIACAAIAIATATFVPIAWKSRSVRPLALREAAADGAGFDREQSAGLFVGIRKFEHEQTLEVPYAADDAVDLAYLFALDRRVSLVPPKRVVLVLAGRPQKEVSRRRLEELKERGAQVETTADQSRIRILLQEQADLAGRDGILIVSLATHGFVSEGTPYLLGSTSLFRFPDTALSAQKILDVTAKSAARRSLIFVDACREWISGGTRGGAPEPMTAAPLVRRMARVEGQVVFYAAAAGKYAYDDDTLQNGVFTKAVLDGLRCEAGLIGGAVTVGTLRTYVNGEVKEWMRRHGHGSSNGAIQVCMDGDAHAMPLSICDPPPAPLNGPARVEADGSIIRTFARDESPLWQLDLGDRVQRVVMTDLNADGTQEVVAGTRSGIVALDEQGKRLWTAEETMPLHAFITGNRYRERARVIAALFTGKDASRIVLYAGDGKVLSTLDHSGRLQHLVLDRETSRHAPKLIVVSANRLFAFDPKKLSSGTQVWSAMIKPASDRIARLEIADRDHDERNEIAISTTSGNTFFVDFAGNMLEHRYAGARSEYVASRSSRAPVIP